MKKRILSLLLVAILAVSLCACGNAGNSNVSNDDISEIKTEQVINAEYEFNKTNNLYVLSVEQAKEFIIATEITTENYKDYITTWEETFEEKDAFGEVISSSKKRMYGIKRELIGSCAVDKVFLLFDKYRYIYEDGSYQEWERDETNPVSGRLEIMGGSGSVGDTIDNTIYFDYECIKAKGNIFSVNIPEELWSLPKDTNENKGKAILVSVPSGKRYYLYQSEISTAGMLFDELYEYEY